MQPDLLQLAVVLGVGAIVGITVARALEAIRRRAWRKRNGWHRRDWTAPYRPAQGTGTVVPAEFRPTDAAAQLRLVMAATFTLQPLLNRSEARVFKELDRLVLGCNPDWQVMAQVSLGEVLRCQDAEAYRSINSKRVDLLLVDEECRPRHAIEYQGAGHHQGTAAARDAVKKEALRRAGIGYHEVIAGQTTPADLKRLVERIVDKPRQESRAGGMLAAPSAAQSEA